MSSKTTKRFLSLIVSLALASAVSLPSIYADDDATIGATIEIPTSSSVGSYSVTVGADGTSTISDTSDDTDGTDTADVTDTADSTDTTDSASDTDVADTTNTEEETDAPAEEETEVPIEDATEAPTEDATEAPEATAAPAAVSATSTETSAAEEVQALIDALPSVEELAEMDTDEQSEVYTDFLAACEAYDALSEDEQAEVDDSKLDDLADYFNGAISTTSTYSSPYELASDEYIDQVLIGTAVTEDDTITSVTPEEFTDYSTSTGYTSSYFNETFSLRDSTITEVNSSYNLYGVGLGLAIPTGKGASTTYTLSDAITSGVLVLRGDITNTQIKEYVEIIGTDSDGTKISIFKFQCGGNSSNYGTAVISINGTEDTFSVQSRSRGVTLDYLIIDLGSGDVKYSVDGVTHWSSGESVVSKTDSGNITNLASVTGIVFGQANTEQASGLAPTFDNVAMYTVESTTTKYKYTVNYQLSDGTVVYTETGNDEAGETVEIAADTYVWGNIDGYTDKKYKVKSTSTNSVAENDTQVFNVTVEECTQYTVSVVPVDSEGTSLTTTAYSDIIYEGESTTVYYPRYVIYNNTAYYINNNSSGSYFGYTFSSVSSDTTTSVNLTYTATSYTKAVFFSEIEDIDGAEVINNGNNNARSSGGKAGRISSGSLTLYKSLPAGTYKIIGATYGRQTFNVYAGSSDNVVWSLAGNGSWNENPGSWFVLTEATDICLASGGDSSTGLDYILIVQSDSNIVTGKNIDLDSGEITMNVYVASDSYNSEGTPSATIGGSEPTHAATATEDSTNSRYIVSQKVLPTQMADEIVFTIPVTDGTLTYKTSVKEYAEAALAELNLEDETDAKKIDVINAMLDYGSAVQMLADTTLTSTDTSLANGGSWQTNDINNVDSTSLANANTGATKKSSTNDDSEWSGPTLSSLNMNFNYNFNLGLTYSDSLKNYTVKVTLGTTEYTVTAAADDTSDSTTDKVIFSSDKKSIIVKNLSAADLLSTLSISLTPTDTSSSTTTYTTTTKPIYYARLLVSKGSGNQPLLGQTLYLYAKAVNDLTSES